MGRFCRASKVNYMLLIRKIIFFVLVVVYVVVCPVLIMYSLGYIYNPVEQQFVQTGIIRLASMPSGADVFLEKSHYKNQTPATISGVLAGEYRITLMKKGYKPWRHLVSVEPGKASAFERILLIPQQWPTKELSQTEYEKLIPLGNEHLFLVAANSNLGSCCIFEKGEKIRPLLNAASPFFELAAAKVYHTPKSNVLVVEERSFWNRKYLYLNIKESPVNAKDITALLDGRPDFIRWDAKNPLKLYAGSSGCINLIDVRAENAYACYLKNVKGFGVYDGDIYAVDANSTLWRLSPDKKKREVLSTDVRLAGQLFDRSDFYEIFAADSGIILFLGTEGELVAHQPPYYISDKNVTGFEFGGNRSLLLYWGRKSVGLADFSPSRDKDIFQTAFRVKTAYTKAKDIRQCFWAYKDSHILCNDDDTLYLIELEPQGDNHIEPVCKIRKGTEVWYEHETGIVYYLEERSGKLEQCRLISPETVVLLP